MKLDKIEVRNDAWAIALFLMTMTSCNTCINVSNMRSDVRQIKNELHQVKK